MKLPVYLDYQATTPLDPRVLDEMMPYFTEKFGNPHSVDHSFGWEADAAVEHARRQVAKLIGAEEVIFTSGATEANNMALKGIAYANLPEKNHLITVNTEHECVLACAASLQEGGFDVTYLDVEPDGLLDLEKLKAAMTDKTALVSVMALNNEIGILQDIAAIGQLCREKNIIFHTDAAQAVGKIPLDVEEMNIDVMSISGHKIYGPKGIGALYVRDGVKLIPLISGGGQEKGLRSGTLSPALCVGLGAACHIADEEMTQDHAHVSGLFDRLLDKIFGELDGVHLNGHREQRFPGNINLCFENVKSDLLVAEMRNIAISTGSACSSAKTGPSHVLKALGVASETSLRIGFGRMTTEEEIDYAADYLINAVNKIRQLFHLHKA